MRRFCLLAALTLAVALAACTTLKKTVLYEDDPEHLWLQYEVKSNQVVPQGYDHPANLTAEQIDAMLAAVRVEEHEFFAWRDQGPLFIKSERQKLAAWLSDALAKASPDQWVSFAVVGVKSHLMIFKSRQLTDGLCFMRDGKFNLVIGNLNYELINPDHEPSRSDPRDMKIYNSIRLKLDPARGIDKPAIVKGDRWLDMDRRNWLIVDLPAFFAPPAVEATPEPAPAAPAAPAFDTARRLEELKKLLDQGLITQEEYDQKRKEILEGL